MNRRACSTVLPAIPPLDWLCMYIYAVRHPARLKHLPTEPEGSIRSVAHSGDMYIMFYYRPYISWKVFTL